MAFPIVPAAAALVALAFGLRIALIGDASVWWDEGFAVWAARLPLVEMARMTSQDTHPPLHYALLHFWLRVAGDSELAIRLPSVACGTLTVAALWQLGRRLMPAWPAVALGGALLLATSRFAIWWSQETRMYALAGLLCALNLVFAARLTERLRWRDAVGYVAVTAAAIWTLYLAGFVLAIDAAFWLAALSYRRTWPDRLRELAVLSCLSIVSVATLVPWLAYALPRMHSWSVQAAFEPQRFAELYATLLTLGVSTDVESVRFPVFIACGLIALGLLALLAQRKAPRIGALLLLSGVLIPPVAVWALTALPRGFGYTPRPEARYLLPFSSVYYLLAAAAVVALASRCGRAKRIVAVALFAGLLAFEVGSLGGYYADRVRVDDYDSVAATLRAYARPNDLVLLHTDDPWPVFAYHWDREFRGTPHLQDADESGAEYFLAPLWSGRDAVWLVVNEDGLRVDPRRLYEQWLKARSVGSREWRFGTKRVVLFARTPARAASLGDLAPGYVPPDSAAQPDANSALVGWEQPLRRVRAGEIANVAVTVRRGTLPPAVEAALWSTTAGGSSPASARANVAAGDGLERLTLALPLPVDATPGRYAWRVRVGERTTEVGAVEILPTPLLLVEPVSPASIAPSHPVGATFGEPPLARLVGYDVETTAGPARVVTVTLYWEALGAAPISYKAFVHLSGPDGPPVAQRDGIPLDGKRPTTSWRAGEDLLDRYEIAVRPDVPAGRYPLRVGFYDPTTGERLGPVRDAGGTALPDGQVSLDAVEVK